jgi:hypothetical protein
MRDERDRDADDEHRVPRVLLVVQCGVLTPSMPA